MAIKVTSQTETQFVVKSSPMYSMGVFGIFLLALVWGVRQSSLIGPEIVLLVAGVFCLGPFLVVSQLTADRQLGTITIVRRHLSGLWRNKEVIPLPTIIAVDCEFEVGRSVALVYLLLLVRDAKSVRFGRTRPHYTKGLKGMLTADPDYREQHIATDLEKFIGVYHPEDEVG